MRTISKFGRIEESVITDQIERTKIALLLDSFEKTGNRALFDEAVKIAKRNNGLYDVSCNFGDPSEMLDWERRNSEPYQLQLL